MPIEHAGFTISNVKFTMDNGKVDRISETNYIYMCFTDYSKAFDWLDRPAL